MHGAFDDFTFRPVGPVGPGLSDQSWTRKRRRTPSETPSALSPRSAGHCIELGRLRPSRSAQRNSLGQFTAVHLAQWKRKAFHRLLAASGAAHPLAQRTVGWGRAQSAPLMSKDDAVMGNQLPTLSALNRGIFLPVSTLCRTLSHSGMGTHK